MEDRIDKIFTLLDQLMEQKNSFDRLTTDSIITLIRGLSESRRYRIERGLHPDIDKETLEKELRWLRGQMLKNNREFVTR